MTSPSIRSKFTPLLDADSRPTRDSRDHANENRREVGPHPRGVAVALRRCSRAAERPSARS